MIKLASDKSFNRYICPLINIKGKTMEYPFELKYNNFHLRCVDGIMGPKQMMVMDIIGTKLIHSFYGNPSFSDRIPTSIEKTVKDKSGQLMSSKLLIFMNEHLPQPNTGLIPETWYSDEGRLSDIDTKYTRIKKPLTIVLNDGILRKELPFLRKYSSRQIGKMIIDARNCWLGMSYPMCFHDGKKYKVLPFNTSGFVSRLISVGEINKTRISKTNKTLEREYQITFDTILGYAFMQNMISCYMDLLPGKFYELSDYAQLYYRLFILSYFPNKSTGKIPKNPLSIDEIRQRLVLKTKDTYMVREIIKRILGELRSEHFIKDFSEEKIDRKYHYRYSRNTWKEITGEENLSDSDLDMTDI